MEGLAQPVWHWPVTITRFCALVHSLSKRWLRWAEARDDHSFCDPRGPQFGEGALFACRLLLELPPQLREDGHGPLSHTITKDKSRMESRSKYVQTIEKNLGIDLCNFKQRWPSWAVREAQKPCRKRVETTQCECWSILSAEGPTQSQGQRTGKWLERSTQNGHLNKGYWPRNAMSSLNSQIRKQ